MHAVQPKTDLTQGVHTALRDAILDGELAAGAWLAPEAMADRLGASRERVVQALDLLRQEGLVVERGRHGLAVAPFASTRVRDLYQVRGALDGLAARLAATRVGARAADALDPLMARGEAAVARRDIAALIAADVAFHEKIYALSGNPEIAGTVRALWPQFRRALSTVVRMRGEDARMSGRSWREHWEIASAIRSGDACAAERRAQLHCLTAGETAADHLAAATPQGH